MPRPLLAEGLAREKSARIRFTKKEFESIERFAHSQGMTISTLVRTSLREYVKALKNIGKTTRVRAFPDTF
jgi:predicted DNA binding CopG/RHH family protein